MTFYFSQGLGIGVVDKIFIQFPQQWWETGCDGFSFLYNLEETSETITKEVLYCSFYVSYDSKVEIIAMWTLDSQMVWLLIIIHHRDGKKYAKK